MTVTIERAIHEAGGGEAGYEAGVRVKNQIRMERERGRRRFSETPMLIGLGQSK